MFVITIGYVHVVVLVLAEPLGVATVPVTLVLRIRPHDF